MNIVSGNKPSGKPASEPGFGEPLTELYSKGQAWDEHKARSQRPELQRALTEALGYRYAGEVSRCSTMLALRRNAESGDLSVRPFETCKRRWCPVCSWRRSLKQWALIVQRLPALIQKHGPVRWLLLTLTVRNCSLDDLPRTVKSMSEAFRRLSHKSSAIGRDWPAQAWLKALEITFPRPGEAHPHFHVLMAVKPSYFTHGYVKQSEWVNRWRRAAGLDYDPIVDIRRIKPDQRLASELGDGLAEALGGLREVAKYVVKPSETDSADALHGLLLLKHRRFIDSGGWLRGILRDGDEGDQSESEPAEMEKLATFWWRAAEFRYRRKIGD